MLTSLKGLIPAMPFDYNPWVDQQLKAQWASQYWQQALNYANSVVSELRAQGFDVQVFGYDCDLAAGCIGLPMLQSVIRKSGRSMDASIGNPVRFNSPQEEALYLANLFGMYATDSSSFQTPFNPLVLVPVPSSGTTSTSAPQTTTTTSTTPSATATSAPEPVTASPAPAATTDRPLAALIEAPNGYVVGRRWKITITGPANQPVSNKAYQDNKDHGSTTYGSTNSSGVFTLEGAFSSDSAGAWVQQWYVGDRFAGLLTFNVSQAASAPQPGEIQTSSAASSTQSAGTNSGPEVEFGTGGINLRVGSIPPWVWLGAIGIAGYALLSGGGRK